MDKAMMVQLEEPAEARLDRGARLERLDDLLDGLG
jgi:hypothetical protein